LIPRIKLAPCDIYLPFTLQWIKFPIRLSYAMTINKAQGQTFDRIGIYPPFSSVYTWSYMLLFLVRAVLKIKARPPVCISRAGTRRRRQTFPWSSVFVPCYFDCDRPIGQTRHTHPWQRREGVLLLPLMRSRIMVLVKEVTFLTLVPGSI
jgi:hypothetical protein